MLEHFTSEVLSESAQSDLETRGINMDDVSGVLAAARAGEPYLHDADGNVLLKKRLGNFTVYLEGCVEASVLTVNRVYSHRVQLLEDQTGVTS